MHASARKQFLALYMPPHGDNSARCHVFAVDATRTNQMPNLTAAFAKALAEAKEAPMLPRDVTFEVRVEVSDRQVHRLLQRLLSTYRDERKGVGACVIVVQSTTPLVQLQTAMPTMLEMPNIPLTQVRKNVFFSLLTNGFCK